MPSKNNPDSDQLDSLHLWQKAEQLLSARNLPAARLVYESLATDRGFSAIANLRLSLIATASGRHRDAVEHAMAAYRERLPDPDLLEMIAKRLLMLGEMRAAIDCASHPAVLGSASPSTPAELGKLMSDASQPDLALKLLEQARIRGLNTPAIRYLIGLSRMYVGETALAEMELERCLAGDPNFAQAHWSLSKLRRQTSALNHVGRLQAVIARLGNDHADAPLLHYALFREFDDIGDSENAWQALSEGTRLRRRHVQYNAADEQAMFDHLLRFGAVMPDARVLDRNEHSDGPVPIFVIGQPRSGTTLLERILGNHPQVTNAGELTDMVMQLRWMCDRSGPRSLDLDLAQRTDAIDWTELGQRYLAHTQWRANGRPFYTDKMPSNFLCAGYILRALPQAKVLHMVREPMDTCFSNLKEPFAGAYPHSYDQVEMAGHYRNYCRLMAHWHSRFPGRILDVNYRELVSEPQRVASEVLTHCGLPWDGNVLEIAKSEESVATASAMQVREPIHQRFLGQWRRYEAELAPMREALGAYVA